MKEKKYTITLSRHEENFSGLRMSETIKQYNPSHEIAPTSENVKRIIQALFPDLTIDTRWMSIAEQIKDSIKYGYFIISVQAKKQIEFESWSVSFEEA